MASITSESELLAGLPAEALPILREVGYFEEDRLSVGDLVPPLELRTLATGEAATIGGPSDRPTALIFGSYT